MTGQSACAFGIKIAVGNEGSVARNPKLSAMSMTGKNQLGVVRCHCVKYSKVGRMNNAKSEIGFTIEIVRDCVVVIPVNVWVVDTSDTDESSVYFPIHLSVG